MDKQSDGDNSSEEIREEVLKKIGKRTHKKKKLEHEMNEIQPEGEFNTGNMHGECIDNKGDKLQLADLLGAIEKNPDTVQSTISSGKIKKDIKHMTKKAVIRYISNIDKN